MGAESQLHHSHGRRTNTISYRIQGNQSVAIILNENFKYILGYLFKFRV